MWNEPHYLRFVTLQQVNPPDRYPWQHYCNPPCNQSARNPMACISWREAKSCAMEDRTSHENVREEYTDGWGESDDEWISSIVAEAFEERAVVVSFFADLSGI